jgi:hypothetical protein
VRLVCWRVLTLGLFLVIGTSCEGTQLEPAVLRTDSAGIEIATILELPRLVLVPVRCRGLRSAGAARVVPEAFAAGLTGGALESVGRHQGDDRPEGEVCSVA